MEVRGAGGFWKSNLEGGAKGNLRVMYGLRQLLRKRVVQFHKRGLGQERLAPSRCKDLVYITLANDQRQERQVTYMFPNANQKYQV